MCHVYAAKQLIVLDTTKVERMVVTLLNSTVNYLKPWLFKWVCSSIRGYFHICNMTDRQKKWAAFAKQLQELVKYALS